MTENPTNEQLGEMLRDRLESHQRLTHLKDETRKLGEAFEALGRYLKRLAEAHVQSSDDANPSESSKQRDAFLQSLSDAERILAIEEYESQLSEKTYKLMLTNRSEISVAVSHLTSLNRALKPFEPQS